MIRGESESDKDERYMAMALRLAAKALDVDEVPVGAVIVASGSVIARSHNQVVTLRDPTAHAEMLAITQAAAALENERLASATLYVSMEPCAMCAGAVLLARIGRVVFAAQDPKAGACGSVVDLLKHPAMLHHPRVDGGIMAEESTALLREFFQKKRGPERSP